MSSSDDEVRAQFLARLTELQAWLRHQEIPYAIIGSVAVSAFVDAGASADFARSHAYHESQKIPDVDLLVPRSALERAQRYAAESKDAEFPVKIDTVAGECYIDYRPTQDRSYLTHGDLSFPVPSALFGPHQATFLGQEITTIDPRVLLHTFGTIGGVVRKKDVPKIVSLAGTIGSGTAVSSFTEDQCSVFSRYAIARKHRYPVFIASKQTWEGLLARLPAKATRAIEHHVSPWAQKAIGRMNRSRPGASVAPPRRTPSRRPNTPPGQDRGD
ncbi:MAG: hypothetical protein ACRC35_12495 [Angustibacter sp.]